MKTNQLVETVYQNALINSMKNEGNYEIDGIRYCGKCKQPKQAWVEWIPDEDGNAMKRLVPITCRCDWEESLREQERDEQERFETSLKRLRAVIDAPEIRWTFADDQAQDSAIAKTCRRYVSKWDEMKRDNMGILFYGSKGTGKTFYAVCIANAIAQKRQTSAFITTAGLMGTLQGSWDKQEIIDALCRFRLLVLDDLGAERDTSYSAELMYSVIDSRYRASLPTVVTTNLDLDDMKKETDLWRSRIYDRVIEMCPIAIRMTGNSRRGEIAEERRRKAKEILRGGTAE